MRDAFVKTTTDLLEQDPRTALVLADISVERFTESMARHPDRVLNVGIREQLTLGVAGGLALTGLRPIAHSYAPFLVDRAYEQIKLDLGHQGVGAILVSIGASFDASDAGRTHQSPGDVALFDSLGGWTVHVPGHADEVGPLLRAAAATDEPVYVRLTGSGNGTARPGAHQLQVVRAAGPGAPLVVAVGPMLDPVLEATNGLPMTVAYTHSPRPLDGAGLRALVGTDLVVVEPYKTGTSAAAVNESLGHRAHRVLHLGVGYQDLHRYGSPADHARWQGLDAAGLRATISAWLDRRS